MNSKKVFTIILGITLIVLPVLILAENNNQAGKNLCDKILDLATKVSERITNREEKIEQKRAEIENRIQERWEEQDEKLSEKRQKWDQNRTEHFAELEKRFEGDNEKQALIAFEEAVSDAIATRRAAIDAAITSFRQGVEQAKNSRRSLIDATKETFKDAVVAAFEKAKTGCQNGVSTATIRQNLRNDLIAAKEKYHDDYQEIEKLSTAMDQLIATRKIAIEKAIQDFKAALDKAKSDFKAAVGEELPEAQD